MSKYLNPFYLKIKMVEYFLAISALPFSFLPRSCFCRTCSNSQGLQLIRFPKALTYKKSQNLD